MNTAPSQVRPTAPSPAPLHDAPSDKARRSLYWVTKVFAAQIKRVRGVPFWRQRRVRKQDQKGRPRLKNRRNARKTNTARTDHEHQQTWRGILDDQRATRNRQSRLHGQSEIKVLHAERVLLDKFAPWLDHIAHQLREGRQHPPYLQCAPATAFVHRIKRRFQS